MDKQTNKKEQSNEKMFQEKKIKRMVLCSQDRMKKNGTRLCLSSSIFGPLRVDTTRLQHPLHEVELDATDGLVLDDREERQHVRVAKVAGEGVAMLVHHPLELAGVGVPGADVLRLQVLQLRVDVVALLLAHFRCYVLRLMFVEQKVKLSREPKPKTTKQCLAMLSLLLLLPSSSTSDPCDILWHSMSTRC